jgi:hypothetical protein
MIAIWFLRSDLWWQIKHVWRGLGRRRRTDGHAANLLEKRCRRHETGRHRRLVDGGPAVAKAAAFNRKESKSTP